MRICSPHCGVAPETTSGGETYERELLARLGRAGVEVELILARGKLHPEGVPHWTVHRFPMGRGLRWYVAPLVVPAAIKRVWHERGFDLLRVHSLRYMGPSALWARRRFNLDVPVVSHHHHLDASPLNRIIEKRVVEASDRVVVGSEFGKRQLAAELGVRTDHVCVVPYGVDAGFAGVPVVASDRGSIPELVAEGQSGFVCDPSAPDRFVERLLLLLGDAALREKFGAAGRERADRLFRWEACVDGTRRVYEETLEAWRRRGGGSP